MAWVNLNDVYVNKAGGTITGDLEVDGNLTINDATGNGTTYNVANEISTLRDSVSQTILYDANGWTIVACGHTVLIRVTGIKTGSGSWDSTSCPYTIPQSYRPKNTWSASVVTENGDSHTGILQVKSSGAINIFNDGNTGSADSRHGSLAYPIGA